MKSFNVLDRAQDIQRSLLLEASAGTGKTFSIENLVIRLLIEKNLLLEQILVVTFTRAATRDLKLRIRENISKALSCLHTKTVDALAPDYLKACIEQGEEYVRECIQRLEQALFGFDQAQIFTIHGFCARMLNQHVLEGDANVGSIADNAQAVSSEQMTRIIRDFFRTELHSEAFSPMQLEILLKYYRYDLEQLECDLVKECLRGEIERTPNFSEQLIAFQDAMKRLHSYGFRAGKIIEDFIAQAPAYKQLCDRSRQLKPEIMEKVQKFAKLFEQELWSSSEFNELLAEGLIFVEALHPKQLKLNAALPKSLHYPNLTQILENELLSIVTTASNPLCIFAKMASGCQAMLQEYLRQNEKLQFDDLLKKMKQALQQPELIDAIRQHYRAAIIDEFQDTDPLQWQIFQTLFPPNCSWGHIYLVGDPKQSIYAFRQADIYTYLAAANQLSAGSHVSLDTNFRSQPSLVAALNAIFASEVVPGLIALPRIKSVLEYQAVKPSLRTTEKDFSDNFGSLHFCLATASQKSGSSLEKLEECFFFPYFIEELHRLHTNDHVAFRQCAILVSDRYQGFRLARALQAADIPCIVQRNSHLTNSKAVRALHELLEALLFPHRMSSLKAALGGNIIAWDHHQVLNLADLVLHEKIIAQCHNLRKIWLSDGFTGLFSQLMISHWDDEHSLEEKILARDAGLEFYNELQQLAEFLMEKEYEERSSPEQLLLLLDKVSNNELQHDNRLHKQQDLSQDAVQILTLHASKGLEYDIVFPLGLVTRPKPMNALIPIQKNGAVHLCAANDTTSKEYQEYCHEIDAEKMRQLYVALTRAKYRVYVPVALLPKCESPKMGHASPMELFLAKLCQGTSSPEDLYKRMANYDGSTLCNWIDMLSCNLKISYSHLPEVNPSAITPLAAVSKGFYKYLLTLQPPAPVHVPCTPLYMRSFTSLAKRGTALHESIEDNTSLPSNSDTGILLHRILEKIPFDLVQIASSSEALLSIIRPYLQNSAFLHWEDYIAKLVLNALQVNLQAGQARFRLCDIPSERRYQEIEFLMPRLEGMEPSTAFLKGVIDLIICHEQKYYIIDWKSNFLGINPESYHQERLEQVMHMHDYFLQARIYRTALQRYLSLVDNRPFNEIYGGAFYLFLRGIDLTDPAAPGIYLVYDD